MISKEGAIIMAKDIIGIVVEHRSSFKVIYKDGKREANSVSFKVIGPVQVTFSFENVTFCSTVPTGDHFITIETDSDSDMCYVRMKTDYESNVVRVALKKAIRSIRVTPEAGCGLISIDIKEYICE